MDKKIVTALVILILVFAGYVLFINRNSTNMTARQKVLKATYPALMWFTKLTGKNASV